VRQCFPADVAGDYREEIVGIDIAPGDTIQIEFNWSGIELQGET
jgi:hypothetical protein